jgi:hypothetical protein
MASVLEVYTTEEQSSVVRFLWAKGLNTKDIHKEMFPVYGQKCILCKAVHNWARNSVKDFSKVADNARPGFIPCLHVIQTNNTLWRICICQSVLFLHGLLNRAFSTGTT